MEKSHQFWNKWKENYGIYQALHKGEIEHKEQQRRLKNSAWILPN